VFTARYALSPYIKQIRFVFKGLILLYKDIAKLNIRSLLSSNFFSNMWLVNSSYVQRSLVIIAPCLLTSYINSIHSKVSYTFKEKRVTWAQQDNTLKTVQ
jgi:hypothetical protein